MASMSCTHCCFERSNCEKLVRRLLTGRAAVPRDFGFWVLMRIETVQSVSHGFQGLRVCPTTTLIANLNLSQLPFDSRLFIKLRSLYQSTGRSLSVRP